LCNIAFLEMENMIKKIRKNKNKLEPYLLRWQLSILKRDQMKTIREDKELSEDERYIDEQMKTRTLKLLNEVVAKAATLLAHKDQT